MIWYITIAVILIGVFGVGAATGIRKYAIQKRDEALEYNSKATYGHKNISVIYRKAWADQSHWLLIALCAAILWPITLAFTPIIAVIGGLIWLILKFIKEDLK